jgi:dephospho-CoA kinase
MIIGLVGRMASGKGEVVKILTEIGYNHITLSSIIRAEAEKRKIKESRENFMKIGNDLRKKEGAGVLAKKCLEIIRQNKTKNNWIIDGIRNPSEIDELRKEENIIILGIVTKKNLLIERILSRKRLGDDITPSEIIKRLDREWGKGEPKDGQQVRECMKLIDIKINNNTSLRELREKITNLNL